MIVADGKSFAMDVLDVFVADGKSFTMDIL